LKNLEEKGAMNLKRSAFALSLAAIAAGPAMADDHRGVPHLDHVFVIMMENHAYNQIIGNPAAPFINSYAWVTAKRPSMQSFELMTPAWTLPITLPLSYCTNVTPESACVITYRLSRKH